MLQCVYCVFGTWVVLCSDTSVVLCSDTSVVLCGWYISGVVWLIRQWCGVVIRQWCPVVAAPGRGTTYGRGSLLRGQAWSVSQRPNSTPEGAAGKEQERSSRGELVGCRRRRMGTVSGAHQVALLVTPYLYKLSRQSGANNCAKPRLLTPMHFIFIAHTHKLLTAAKVNVYFP